MANMKMVTILLEISLANNLKTPLVIFQEIYVSIYGGFGEGGERERELTKQMPKSALVFLPPVKSIVDA